MPQPSEKSTSDARNRRSRWASRRTAKNLGQIMPQSTSQQGTGPLPTTTYLDFTPGKEFNKANALAAVKGGTQLVGVAGGWLQAAKALKAARTNRIGDHLTGALDPALDRKIASDLLRYLRHVAEEGVHMGYTAVRDRVRAKPHASAASNQGEAYEETWDDVREGRVLLLRRRPWSRWGDRLPAGTGREAESGSNSVWRSQATNLISQATPTTTTRSATIFTSPWTMESWWSHVWEPALGQRPPRSKKG